MATNLRRLAVLGPAGTIYPGSTQDYRAASNRAFVKDTKTKWVRLWADWPTLMPTPGQLDAARITALDAQIAQAKADGLSVILTTYRFPTWANGTDKLTADQLATTMPDRRYSTESDTKAKSLLFRYPDDVSAQSAWGQWIALLVARYSRTSKTRPNAGAVIDFLELCNEPNLQWWPQQAPSTTTDPYAQAAVAVHDVVVRMFRTGQAITAQYGGAPGLMGPGASDGVDTNRLKTGYASLMNRMLDAFGASGFVPGPTFAWSHHNYTDVTYDQGVGTTSPDAATKTRTTNYAADVRRRLVNRWAGWPNADAANPSAFLTEGGATLTNMALRWGISDAAGQRAKQAELVSRSWNRMVGTTEGAGIQMTSNYLFYSDVNFDSGLCEPAENGGAKRPAYTTWKSLPSFA